MAKSLDAQPSPTVVTALLRALGDRDSSGTAFSALRSLAYEAPNDLSQILTDTASLSARFECPALAVLNHDDDILWYRLYERGQLVDEYDSTPGYFEGKASEPAGGNAARLCALMGSQNVEAVASVLHKAQGIEGYVFAVQRHGDLAHALGIPIFTVGLGYRYIELGQIPGDLDRESLERTG
jgi:hypothetical protein